MTPHDVDITLVPSKELHLVDTATLRRELVAQMTITAKALTRMGEIWFELVRRGEDLSDIKFSLAPYLPMVATGKLRAEAVVRFAGKSMLLKAISGLPIEQQDQVLEAGEITIVEQDPKDAPRAIPLGKLRTEHVRLAFSPAGIRTVQEQQKVLQIQKIRETPIIDAAPKVSRPAHIDIDKSSGHLKSGLKFITDKDGQRITVNDLVYVLSNHFEVDLKEIFKGSVNSGATSY